MSVFSYHPDPWLSSILKIDAYRVSNNESTGTQTHPPRGFLYAKVPTNKTDLVSALSPLGFVVVDTNVTFDTHRLCGPVPSKEDDELTIRIANPSDRENIATVAAQAFRFTRFHLDPLISNDIADEIKRSWVENFFDGLRGTHLLVAEHRDLVVGFLLLLQPTQHEFVIDLIGVRPSDQGKGIGQHLIRSIERLCGSYEKLIVGTQVANIPSVRLYEKLGFRLHSSHYVLHAHTHL